jgi:two-component system sensor histidine kinase KdpD
MKNLAIRLARAAASVAVTWGTVAIIHSLKTTNRSIASMALVLEVLATSTLGDRMLAVVASVSAALGFSWYFVDDSGSLAINTIEGKLTFSMMTLTALIGSHLAIRAQERAAEAIRRREEMERLHQLGTALLASTTVGAAAQNIVDELVRLFSVRGAVLTIHGITPTFSAGVNRGPMETVLKEEGTRYTLNLYGEMPSAEVRSALRNLIDLVLDRARAAEQQTQLEATHRGEEFRKTVLNSLAHNFRTPLTSIKAAASILRGTREVPEDNARELATVIDEEADRLDQMIRESLDLARIEARQASPRNEKCSLSEIVSSVSGRIARHLRGRQMTIDVPEDLPALYGDCFLLEQMVMQVVDNAWKYSLPGSAIRITGGSAEGGLYLEVLNEGPQIPRDEQERIFGKFYRGKQMRSSVEGTGMGLPIARSIAEAHGGQLQLGSHPAGPLFRFKLRIGDGGEGARDKHDSEPQHIGG